MDQPEEGKTKSVLVQFCFCTFISIVSLCLLLNYLIYTRTVQRWKKTNMPFSHPTFLIGHKYFLKGSKYSIQWIIDRMYNENESKDIIAFFMLTKPVALIKNPTLIKYILSKNFDKTYEHGPRALKDDIETQNMILFASDKTLWKTGRTLMAPAFSVSKMYGDTEFSKIKKQIDKVLKYAENTEIEGHPMDVCETAQNFIIDTFALWGLGEDQNSFQKKTEFYEIVTSFNAQSYIRLFKILLIVFFPSVQKFEMFQFTERKYKEFFRKVLTDQMKRRREFSLTHNDVIDHLMSLKRKDVIGPKTGNSDSLLEEYEELRMKQLVGYSLSTFTAAGSSPPLALIYSVHLLSLHPEYQDEIRNEIEEIMLKHQVTEFTAEVVKDLQFTEQCILEAQRLFPPLPGILRHCTEDIQLPGGKISLKKGDLLWLSPYSMHHDPKYFKDPEKFDPERFSPQNRASISPEVYLPFGYGPRKCPGYKQGNFIVVYCVAALVQRYDIYPHSHLKQMDLRDFHPRGSVNAPRKNLLVKLVRRKTVTL